jgi:hypothetical protein
MSEISGSSNPAGKTVVLVLPKASGDPDPEKLRATLVDPSRSVRVLLYLPDSMGRAFAATLATLRIETEILLAPEVDAPETGAFYLHMLPGTLPKDQIEFALALSDVVLVAPEFEESALAAAARDYAKPIVAPGGRLPDIASSTPVTDHLDPELPGLRSRGRGVFGRLEQGIIESLAFAWLGWTKEGMAESRKQVRKCVGRKWLPGSYFAPAGWEELAPDKEAKDASSRIVASFDAMDRSAVHGSYMHRDLVWLAYFGAAFAVFAAVAGHLSEGAHGDAGEGIAWGVTELVTLMIVAALVLSSRRFSLQERWTACRLGAEQLRIARMSLPLLVLPPALATADTRPAGNARTSKESELGLVALAQVKRIVRDQGLPRLDPAPTPARAARWLQCIIDDQTNYHHRNHHKLERAEGRLRFATQAFFVIAMIAVLVHFCSHARWLLLLTAAGPAAAAALHGAGTRLGIVHRAALSLDMERELKQIGAALKKLIDSPPPVELDAWREVRRLAFEAANAMGRESTSWHGLVRRYRDELP